jgi:hypothetical protein
VSRSDSGRLLLKNDVLDFVAATNQLFDFIHGDGLLQSFELTARDLAQIAFALTNLTVKPVSRSGRR